MARILAVGHATIDLFFKLSNAHLHRVDTASQELCLKYPEKLMIREMEIDLGGNAPNVGVGLVKLGHEVNLLAEVGSDVFGEATKSMLREKGINLTYVTSEDGGDISAILNFQSERTILAYHPNRDWQWPSINEGINAIYLSSLGETGFQDFHGQIATWLSEHPDVKLFYNPGKDELDVRLDRLVILESTHVLYANKQEYARLLGMEVSEDAGEDVVHEFAQTVWDCGPEYVIITDGTNGSYGYDGNKFYHLPIFPCDAVERTGAGDAFSSGSMAAFLDGKSLFEALMWGSAQSTSVIQQVGATKGLLTEDGVHEILAEYEEVKPREIQI